MENAPAQLPPAPGLVPRPPARDAVAPVQYLEASAYGYGPYQDQAEGAGALVEYWRIIRRGKWTLIFVAFAAALLAVLLTLPQTPVFQARATLEIQPLNEDFLNMRQMSPVQQSPVTDYTLGDIPTQVKILESATLLKRTSDRLKTARKPGAPAPKTDRISAWRSVFKLPEPKDVSPYEAALMDAAGKVKIRSAGETRIVEILCDSTDPKLAADYVNTLADEYIKQNLEVRWNMSQRTGEWLSKQLDDMRIKLERSEDSLQAYARSAGLIFSSENGSKLSEEQLRQVQTELGRAQADRVAQQSRYEIARTSPPEALADILDNTTLRAYQTRLTELRQQLADAGSTYTPAHIKVKRLQAQVAEVEAAFKRERDSILSRIKNDYDQSVRRERLLLADYTRQTGRVTADAEKAIQYNILKREVDSNRQLYEAMLQRVKESSIASAMRASNVRVVDAATVPEAPYKPSLPRNGSLGLLGGLFIGAAFLIVRDRYDRTIQNPDDAAFHLGLAELGVIPSAKSPARRLYYRRGHSDSDRGHSENNVRGHSSGVPSLSEANESRRGHSEKSVRGHSSGVPSLSSPGALTLSPQPADRVELVTFQNRGSVLAESFRVALTSILFSGQNGSRPRVLVLTSANPSEGKSTVASNLGIALAEAGQKVLLIDGDLRKPRLHTIFEAPNAVGLGDILRDRNTDVASALETMVHETLVPGLSLLSSGPPTAAATNLLYSPQLTELIKAARAAYDMVLVDSPPAVNIADSRVLGRVADAVVVVIRSRRTSRDVLKNACQRFTEDGTRVLGAIINDWDPSNAHSGYGYGRYYSNGYKSSYYTHDPQQPQQ